jgi:hypothetical protein
MMFLCLDFEIGLITSGLSFPLVDGRCSIKTKVKVMWYIDPFLGNDSVNTFPRQRIRRQQSDNSLCLAMRCKYNNRGRGVFYVVRRYQLLGNWCVFYGSASRLYMLYRTESKESYIENEASPRQSRKKGSAEDWLWVLVIDCDYDWL